MPVNFMGVEVGDAVLGGLQVVEIRATRGCLFESLRISVRERRKRTPARCATSWSTMRGGPRIRDSTM
jgi:hypothetical protein